MKLLHVWHWFSKPLVELLLVEALWDTFRKKSNTTLQPIIHCLWDRGLWPTKPACPAASAKQPNQKHIPLKKKTHFLEPLGTSRHV